MSRNLEKSNERSSRYVSISPVICLKLREKSLTQKSIVRCVSAKNLVNKSWRYSEKIRIRMLLRDQYPETIVILANADERASDVTTLTRPVYSFLDRTHWKKAANMVLTSVPRHGVYLVAIHWALKRSNQLMDGSQFRNDKASVLHCVCKEPLNRYRGLIGPIHAFIPHLNPKKGYLIRGILISVFKNAPITYDFVPNQVIGDDYNRRLKRANPKFNQVVFFVSKDGACVGMQVLHTKDHEKRLKRIKTNFHHERPLIIEDGFYILEGIFSTKFLNYDRTKAMMNNITPDSFGTIQTPKVVIIGEGTHLIRTNNDGEPKLGQENRLKLNIGEKSDSKSVIGNIENDWQESENAGVDAEKYTIQKIEVCLDSHYSRVIMLDYQQLNIDFRFEIIDEKSS